MQNGPMSEGFQRLSVLMDQRKSEDVRGLSILNKCTITDICPSSLNCAGNMYVCVCVCSKEQKLACHTYCYAMQHDGYDAVSMVTECVF